MRSDLLRHIIIHIVDFHLDRSCAVFFIEEISNLHGVSFSLFKDLHAVIADQIVQQRALYASGHIVQMEISLVSFRKLRLFARRKHGFKFHAH